jgi:hypothetical protein
MIQAVKRMIFAPPEKTQTLLTWEGARVERGQDILRRLYSLAHTAIRFVCGLYGHCSQWLRLASAGARCCRLLCTELRSKGKPFLKLGLQTSANRQIPEFAKPDKLLYGTLAFSAEVIAQVHE